MTPGRSDDGDKVTELTVLHSRSEAELLVAMLRAEGLRVMVSADDGGGWGPNVGIEGVRIMVLEDDLDAAGAALRRADSGRPPRPTKRRPGG